jgi:hypothetical protein
LSCRASPPCPEVSSAFIQVEPGSARDASQDDAEKDMKRPGGQSCLFLLSDNLHFAKVVVRIGAQRFFGCVLSIKKGRVLQKPRSLHRLTGFGENRVLSGFGAAPSLKPAFGAQAIFAILSRSRTGK